MLACIGADALYKRYLRFVEAMAFAERDAIPGYERAVQAMHRLCARPR